MADSIIIYGEIEITLVGGPRDGDKITVKAVDGIPRRLTHCSKYTPDGATESKAVSYSVERRPDGRIVDHHRFVYDDPVEETITIPVALVRKIAGKIIMHCCHPEYPFGPHQEDCVVKCLKELLEAHDG